MVEYRQELIAKTLYTSTLLVALLSTLIGCASTKVSSQPPDSTNFSGTWLLNESLSADTLGAIAYEVSQAREARSNDGGSRGMRGGGGRQGSRPGGGGSRGGGQRDAGDGGNTVSPSRERLDDIVWELSPTSKDLVILQTATEFLVTHGTQWEYQHVFGAEQTISVAGQDAQQLTGWQDQMYVVETKAKSGVRVTERFSLVPESDRLQISLTIESKRLTNPIVVARFYDKVPETALLDI